MIGRDREDGLQFAAHHALRTVQCPAHVHGGSAELCITHLRIQLKAHRPQRGSTAWGEDNGNDPQRACACLQKSLL